MRRTIVRFRARALAAAAVVALSAVLGGAGCVPAPAPGAAVETVEIATWNLAWLHGQDGKGAIRRYEADYARLRAYAARLDADVVALQEVADEDAAARVFDPALYTVAMSMERDAQRTGFAYKKELAVTRYPDLVELDVGGLRRGVDIGVRIGNQELRLLAVHLKSGCFSGALGRDRAACAKLGRQIPALEAWIDARERQGVAFAVLGDFNRRLSRDDEVWRALDDRDPVAADLTLLTEGRRSRCWNGKYPDLIDHIVLDAQAAAWLVPGSFEQIVYDQADARHRATLSDHCPISVRLALPGAVSKHDPVKASEPGRDTRSAPEAAAPGRDTRSAPVEAAAPGRSAAPKRSSGAVKGNVSRGRKLYHLPGCPSYDAVRIDHDRGERLFESEDEAQAAGFHKAGNCP